MKRNILVVEDDQDIRESMCEMLALDGHTVAAAENGAEALACLEQAATPPDLIFLDLMMPVKDGFQFRAEQRADDRFAHIPVVVMSADPDLADHHALLGALSYLRKPFDMHALLDVAGA